MNEFVLLAFLLFMAKKRKFVRSFLGESTARESAYGFIRPLPTMYLALVQLISFWQGLTA